MHHTYIHVHNVRIECIHGAVFATIFRERYNYITEAKKMHCRACKWPFWANVDISKNGDGGGIQGCPRFWHIHSGN